jgi:hypothetical protein
MLLFTVVNTARCAGLTATPSRREFIGMTAVITDSTELTFEQIFL